MAYLKESAVWVDGIYQLETSDPVVGGEDGIANVQAKNLASRTSYLKKEVERVEQEIRSTGIFAFDVIPTLKSGDFIYVAGIGMLEWGKIGSYEGYFSTHLGKFDTDTQEVVRPNELSLLGEIFNKSKYPALFAWAQSHKHVVSSSSWQPGAFRFVDLGGDNFRVPDLRNVFIRATGTDADNANARGLGSYQSDALQNITGGLSDLVYQNNATHPYIFANGAFYQNLNSQNIGHSPAGGLNNGVAGDHIIFDASRVARTSTETRGSNVALAPRIVAY